MRLQPGFRIATSFSWWWAANITLTPAGFKPAWNRVRDTAFKAVIKPAKSRLQVYKSKHNGSTS